MEPIALLGVISIFIIIVIMQMYLNSVFQKRVKSITAKLKEVEHFLGLDLMDNQLEWTTEKDHAQAYNELVGSAFPPLDTTTFLGTALTPDFLTGQQVLLLFLSPHCSTCTILLDEMLEYVDSAKEPLLIPSTIVVLSESILRSDIDEKGVDSNISILQATLDSKKRIDYGIRFTPSVLLLNEDGTIHSAGMVHRLQEIVDQSKDFVSLQRRAVATPLKRA